MGLRVCMSVRPAKPYTIFFRPADATGEGGGWRLAFGY